MKKQNKKRRYNQKGKVSKQYTSWMIIFRKMINTWFTKLMKILNMDLKH